jgi:hypothetical protein
MLYVILSKDVKSSAGRLYAKGGKRLLVLFRRGANYICAVGKYSVPVFASQVERELTRKNDEEENVEAIEDESGEGGGTDGEDQGGTLFDHLRN